MNQKDTTIYKVNLDEVISYNNKEGKITIEAIQSKKDDYSFLTNPILISLVFPLLVTLLTFWITRLLTRKKERAELKRVETETDKNQVEINQIKSSFQPIVISSLQSVQNEIFKDKTSSLKDLIKSKSDLFNVEQIYHEGNAIIEDSYEYYRSVYLNFGSSLLNRIKKNSLDNSSLFPNSIRDEFQKLMKSLFEIHEIQKMEFSKEVQDMPAEIEKKLVTISENFDSLIDMMRNDLHLNNTYIHDFISEHQKVKNK